jgi:peroxiredoxin
MTVEQVRSVRPGTALIYNDRREGHRGIKAIVLTVNDRYLVAQFEDRADTTKVEFIPEWLRYLTQQIGS